MRSGVPRSAGSWHWSIAASCALRCFRARCSCSVIRLAPTGRGTAGRFPWVAAAGQGIPPPPVQRPPPAPSPDRSRRAVSGSWPALSIRSVITVTRWARPRAVHHGLHGRGLAADGIQQGHVCARQRDGHGETGKATPGAHVNGQSALLGVLQLLLQWPEAVEHLVDPVVITLHQSREVDPTRSNCATDPEEPSAAAAATGWGLQPSASQNAAPGQESGMGCCGNSL